MKESIRSLFHGLGADVCGFAHVSAFGEAPEGFGPTDIFDACRSVIVFGTAIPSGMLDVNPRIVYGHFNEISPMQLDHIALQAAVSLERKYGARAVPVPSDGPYEYWDAENRDGRGLMSMKHAAVRAGLGTLGKSTMLLHPIYGARLNLGAVLTTLDLASDPPAEPVCLPDCRICLDGCPVGAIGETGVSQKLCRGYAYGSNDRGFDVVNCNRCRANCPAVTREQ